MRFAPALLLLPLAGCTQDAGRYPSLLPRAIESESLAEPERPVPVAEPDPALDKQIAAIAGQLDDAAKTFAASAQNAEAMIAVARGVPAGSDAWLDAQTALGDLQQQHVPALSALADLDRLAIDRGAAGKPPYPLLDSVRARADALTRDQDKRIAGLEAALAGD